MPPIEAIDGSCETSDGLALHYRAWLPPGRAGSRDRLSPEGGVARGEGPLADARDLSQDVVAVDDPYELPLLADEGGRRLLREQGGQPIEGHVGVHHREGRMHELRDRPVEDLPVL